MARVEPLQVDPTCPPGDPVNALAQQHVDGRPRRRERPPGQPVDGRHPSPDGAFGLAQPVTSGEAGEVGLVDGDARQPQPPGCEGGLRAQPRRCGQVHDIGSEFRQNADQPGPRSGDPEGRISWHWNRGCTQYPCPGVDVGVGSWYLSSRCGGDDERFVPAILQMFEHTADRVRHPVHVRQERLCDHCYAHDTRLPSYGDRSRTSARPRREHCGTT